MGQLAALGWIQEREGGTAGPAILGDAYEKSQAGRVCRLKTIGVREGSATYVHNVDTGAQLHRPERARTPQSHSAYFCPEARHQSGLGAHLRPPAARPASEQRADPREKAAARHFGSAPVRGLADRRMARARWHLEIRINYIENRDVSVSFAGSAGAKRFFRYVTSTAVRSHAS